MALESRLKVELCAELLPCSPLARALPAGTDTGATFSTASGRGSDAAGHVT